MSVLRIRSDFAEPRELPFSGERLLLDLLRAVGVELERECAGQGTCGSCVVRIVSGKYRSRVTGGGLPAELAAEGYVLACQTRVQGDTTVEVAEQWLVEPQPPLAAAPHVLLSERLLPPKWEFEPISKKYFLRVPPSTVEDSFSDLDRVTLEIERIVGPREPFCELELLRELPAVLREKDGELSVCLLHWTDQYTIVNFQAGNTASQHYGIACDVGTTTVAVHLVDLNSGEILGTEAGYNQQVLCGADVISRIEHASKPERLLELHRLVAGTIDELVSALTRKYAINPRDVSNAVFTGNTTMIHLLLAIDPQHIRTAPYVPAVNELPQFKAWELGLTSINRFTRVHCAPGVGSYVGGDVTAGLLCIERDEQVMMYLDIGTNGELVIGNQDWLITCACSAGPAFEGSGLAHGMRASSGAIERVVLEAGGQRVTCQTIDGTPARGLCGSAIIELLGELSRHGLIDRAGRFDASAGGERVREAQPGRVEFVVEQAANTAVGRDITLSEREIQTVIRAKAAIYAAMRILLAKVGLSFADVAKVYIAGGFGRYLNIESGVQIGLLPDIARDHFHYIGNASLTGGYLALLSRNKRERLQEIARSMTYVELSVEPGYMDEYSGALFLPHTSFELFPSVRRGP
jgi:uncharacterized 2Fe-2S/4Fe-4S cluster protein (DUF4445 family)